jgi:hypothetical protein
MSNLPLQELVAIAEEIKAMKKDTRKLLELWDVNFPKQLPKVQEKENERVCNDCISEVDFNVL